MKANMKVIEKQALRYFEQLDTYVKEHGRQPHSHRSGNQQNYEDERRLVHRLIYHFGGLPRAMDYRQHFVDNVRYCPACSVPWKGGFSCWCGFKISRLEIEERGEVLYLRIFGKQNKKLVKRSIISFDRVYEQYIEQIKQARKAYIEMLLSPDHKNALVKYLDACWKHFEEYEGKIGKMIKWK